MICVTVRVDDTVCQKERRDFWTHSTSVQPVLACAMDHVPGWRHLVDTEIHISVRITDPTSMSQYNNTHRQQHKSTNILSFPVMGPNHVPIGSLAK